MKNWPKISVERGEYLKEERRGEKASQVASPVIFDRYEAKKEVNEFVNKTRNRSV